MSKKKFFVVFILLSVSSVFAQTKLKIKDQNIYAEYSDLFSSVNIYYENEHDKRFAVLDLKEYGKSTFVGFVLDKKYYNLKESASVNYKAYVNENSLYVEYSIKDKIKFTILYSILKNNILKINYVVENTDSKAHEIAFKSVFDTFLGERYNTVFSTSAKSKINSEYIISDFKKHQKLISSDGKIKIAFLLDEQLTKDAYKVVVAGKPYLSTNELNTHFIEGRGFNTVLSYNNSCVGFFFKSGVLPPKSKKTFEQKIYFESDKFSSENKSLDETSFTESETFEDSSTSSIPVVTAPVIDSPVEVQSAETKQEKKVESNEQKSITNKEVPTDLENDKKRVKEIIERIKQIKDDGSDTNREEISKLQLELTELMKKIEKAK